MSSVVVASEQQLDRNEGNTGRRNGRRSPRKTLRSEGRAGKEWMRSHDTAAGFLHPPGLAGLSGV
jgi:hypothetical protein